MPFSKTAENKSIPGGKSIPDASSKESGWITSSGSPASIEDQPISGFEDLQARWYSALEKGFQSKRLKVRSFNQDGRARLFYVLSEDSTTEPLKTTIRARCLRDDLAVFDLEITYKMAESGGPAAGIAGATQTVAFKLIKDPKTVGVNPRETANLVDMIINGRNP